MRRRALQTVLLLLAVALMADGVLAQQGRSVSKYHHIVKSGSTVLGEFTFIGTSDGLRPMVNRYLVQLPSGARAVVRNSIDTGGIGTTSISSVTGQQSIAFAIDINGNVTVTYGASSFAFHEDDASSPEVRQQGWALLSGAPAAFKDLVVDVAVLGWRSSPLLHNLGQLVGASIVEMSGELASLEGEPLEIVAEFDPSTIPPGPFESPFGSAYYE